MLSRNCIGSLLIALACCGLAFGQADVSPLLKSGDENFRAQKFDAAWKDYDKANKLSGEKSSICLGKMALTKMNMRDEGAALKLADRAIAAADNPIQRADSFAVKGEILVMFSQNDDKRLPRAEDAFRNAAKDDPNSDVYQARLGNILLREGKLDEGKAELEGYLKKHPSGPSADIVRGWLSHPSKVRYSLAPEFVLRTIAGEEITSKSLAGRVVVIDFWATWCPPCRASVPELKDLTQKYSRDKLVVISVSSDSDEEQWKKFVAEKQMSWPQYIDSDKHMTKIFGVHAFPTYIIIDGDGYVRERLMSFDPHESLAHRLKEPLQKLLE